ncbi:uncharacterized protein LOC6036617 [Culex quinquefasciatus]|uniref:uncharacterized protein LOC6036617 n=1 Tax=Culex quinquefasciatus TaxID=7176 RepID=UPI0018E32EA6|nr:uncharacterized protein LOC6036617 [Culex quinquefasciatus]
MSKTPFSASGRSGRLSSVFVDLLPHDRDRSPQLGRRDQFEHPGTHLHDRFPLDAADQRGHRNDEDRPAKDQSRTARATAGNDDHNRRHSNKSLNGRVYLEKPVSQAPTSSTLLHSPTNVMPGTSASSSGSRNQPKRLHQNSAAPHEPSADVNQHAPPGFVGHENAIAEATHDHLRSYRHA